MKSRLIALTIAVITTVVMLPSGASAKWKKDNNEKWKYKDNNNNDSVGWAQVDGNWYHFNANGEMQSGWIQENGLWYFLSPNGDMAHDTFIEGYYLGADGRWVVNITTGAAVNITTGSAVNVTTSSSDDTTNQEITNVATDNNNFGGIANGHNEEKEKLEYHNNKGNKIWKQK